jgi:uncharacterized protein (TIGR04255 family)
MSNDTLSLTNPPIVEAIFNIQTSGGIKFLDIEMEIVESFLTQDYAKFVPFKEAAFNFDGQQADQALSPEIKLKGYRADSEDQTQVVQYIDNNFTFNRLKPYQGFEGHLIEALRLWNKYKEFTTPELINRITLRNVNQISFDQQYNLEELFTIYPERAQFTGLTRNGFNIRGQYTDANSEIKCNVVLIQKDAQTNSYFLDIECYADTSIEATADVSVYFEKLRKLKNKIFTGALTSKGLDILKTQ